MCRGFFHAPGTLVPLSEFSFHKRGTRVGKPFSQCRRCTNHRRQNPKGNTDWNSYVEVPIEIVEELRRRIGPYEAARRAGLYIDVLLPGRVRRHRMRQSTVDKLNAVLEEARVKGEDNFDPASVRLSQLIPGGPPGAREKATRAMVAMWEHRMRERAKIARSKARRRLGSRFEFTWKPVDETPPDPVWWHHTGQEWLPRWGEEMLGSDF
jgi:hypothetical protein